MTMQVIFKAIKISLQNKIPHESQLELKFCFNHQIHRFKSIYWNTNNCRWELHENVYLKLLTSTKIQVQLLCQKIENAHKNIKCNVIAGMQFDLQSLKQFSKKQHKVMLTYDFQVVGAMYFQFQMRNNSNLLEKLPNSSIYFQKAEIKWSEKQERKYEFAIKRQEISIFENNKCCIGSKAVSFIINKQEKTVFSTIYNFVIHFQDNTQILIPFHIDKIERGIRSQIVFWLTKNKKKAGQLKITYFLQNVFLQNKKGQNSNGISNRSIIKKTHNILDSPQKYLRIKKQMSIQKKAQLNLCLSTRNKQNNVKRFSQVTAQITQLIKSQGKVKFTQKK